MTVRATEPQSRAQKLSNHPVLQDEGSSFVVYCWSDLERSAHNTRLIRTVREHRGRRSDFITLMAIRLGPYTSSTERLMVAWWRLFVDRRKLNRGRCWYLVARLGFSPRRGILLSSPVADRLFFFHLLLPPSPTSHLPPPPPRLPSRSLQPTFFSSSP